MDMIEDLGDGRLLLKVDKTIYHQESILSTAYKFTDSCYIQIDSIDSNYYGVYFTVKNPSVDLVSQVNNFCNELIDQETRYNLHKSNKTIKELIVKKAFFPFQTNE